MQRGRAARSGVVALFTAAAVAAQPTVDQPIPVTQSATFSIEDTAPPDVRTEQENGQVEQSGMERSELTFSAIGASAPLHVTGLAVRTSPDGRNWSMWEPMTFLTAEDGPDRGAGEPRHTLRQHTTLLWVGEASHLQLLVDNGSPADIDVTVIDTLGLNNGPSVQAPDDPEQLHDLEEPQLLDIVTREQWGADETAGFATRTAEQVHMAVIHHTAHTSDPVRANSYTPEEAPALIRAMHSYHTRQLGWADIGYNILIDRFGTIYEGRKGGFVNGVVGAHAAGFNTGSFGVAVIGNFVDEQAPEPALEALTNVVAVKSSIHNVDPARTTNKMGNGTQRPTVIGHRDVSSTACPGMIHAFLPELRAQAADIAVRFPDVPQDSPHRPSIIALANDQLVHGCELNRFCPQEPLNRAQAATFIFRALQIAPAPVHEGTFTDVNATQTHAESIHSLAAHGLLAGYPDGSFKPWEHLTRAQLATILARALELPLEHTGSGKPPYPDVAPDSVHGPAISALATVGVVGNCGNGKFCPNNTALRNSTASFVQMARNAAQQADTNNDEPTLP